MDYKSPSEVVKDLVKSGAGKSKLALRDILVRGFLSGAFLGFATVLAYTATVQSGMGVLGALVFPVGFAMIILLGLELVTGNFATIPMAVVDGQSSFGGLFRNWVWAFLGNLAGSVFFGALFFVCVTKMGHDYENDVVKKIVAVAQDKTIAYKNLGGAGMAVSLAKAVLCNWMVTMGVVMGAASTSVPGKIAALWMPIFIFFALGLEHCVVNMFVIPTSILLGSGVSFSDWWLWNQIPVTFGNIIGGAVFTGMLLQCTWGRRP